MMNATPASAAHTTSGQGTHHNDERDPDHHRPPAIAPLGQAAGVSALR